MTTAQIETLFGDLKAGLVPLVKEIAARPGVDDSSSLPYDTRRNGTSRSFSSVGSADFRRGRQDRAAHPFTTQFGSNTDVRVTTRTHTRDDAPVGNLQYGPRGRHALYELGSPDKLERTLLAGGSTLGLHESQSRLWENQVARSLPFWHYYHHPAGLLPAATGECIDDHVPPCHQQGRAQPDFASKLMEVTYNLHIFVRFELEKSLLTGSLGVRGSPRPGMPDTRSTWGSRLPAAMPTAACRMSTGLTGYKAISPRTRLGT